MFHLLFVIYSNIMIFAYIVEQKITFIKKICLDWRNNLIARNEIMEFSGEFILSA